MKFVCLGYIEEKKFSEFTEEERNAFFDACCEYDDELKKNGHFVGGEAMDTSQTARTLRFKNGKISTTDGPFAETKEQLGGIMLLEAEDMNHAVGLIAKHPSLRFGGTWEIRPSEDLSGMVKESEERRSAKKISL
jgi:hypothetical protein